ncbi:hypothetical protein Pla100_60610 [Neorhodopirellula pilleata]|uniref:Uncharacterized protein n=1 Tax=Neorhodopirellula pilleata TaxID=2714738 RepID=A0A5C5ZGT3_9BACT|nr:hypothetical protein Pla100_60610 [Neorhodopirellula pilleata]
MQVNRSQVRVVGIGRTSQRIVIAAEEVNVPATDRPAAVGSGDRVLSINAGTVEVSIAKNVGATKDDVIARATIEAVRSAGSDDDIVVGSARRVDFGDIDCCRAGRTERAASPLNSAVAVIERPIKIDAVRRSFAAVGVGDLLHDRVDVVVRRCLTVGIGEGDDQLTRRRGCVKCGDHLTVFDQVTA